MLQLLKEKSRLNETILLGVLSLFCFSLSLFRVLYTDSGMFLFLNWNLFLAFLPWVFTSIAIVNPSIQRSKIFIGLLLGSWLLFFPNAPYILTDLFHLRSRSAMPMWFDLLLILSFAWTGLLYGFLSLWDIEKILSAQFKITWISAISIALLFLSSFGIYIGRFLRWNSWDIISEPSGIIYDIGHRLINPFEHPRTWGMTLLMGLFLNMMYWSFRMIRKREAIVRAESKSLHFSEYKPEGGFGEL